MAEINWRKLLLTIMATQKQIKILKRVERNDRPLILECKEIIRSQQDVDAQALRAVT